MLHRKAGELSPEATEAAFDYGAGGRSASA